MGMALKKYPRQARRDRADLSDGGIPIGSLIGPLLKSVKLDEQGRLGVLDTQWASAVGPGVAAHTRPGRLMNKELTVFVDSSPWLHELKRYAHREMLANLQKTFGAATVRSIRLQLDPGQGGDADMKNPS